MENTPNNRSLRTRWYHYLSGFFAGIFLVNVLPHFINGITGKAFPTPFADPPGIGLSSPKLNVLWATINFAIGFALLYWMKVTRRSAKVWIAVAAGILLMAFFLADHFGRVAAL